MDRQGGSIARVLRDVDLPFALIERPDIVIPLREQFRFLERAARETGDECFGARLGQAVRMKDLSGFGSWVCSADTLGLAIVRGNSGIGAMLQTSTVLTLEPRGTSMRWSIEFVEPETEGRRHNELLAIGYMIDLVRHYAGPKWRPEAVMCTLPKGAPRAGLRDVFAADISLGHAVTSIEFDDSFLNYCRPVSTSGSLLGSKLAEPQVPKQDDALASIVAVTNLALCEGYPRVDWVARKLGLSRRTLQRQLESHGTNFQRMVDEALSLRARALLDAGGIPITDIALTLGYHDTAHFTRAFRRWNGVSPSEYQRRARS